MSIKIENVEISGWEAAIRGARNPMNSWDKSDSWIINEYADHGRRIKAHQICQKHTNKDYYYNPELKEKILEEIRNTYTDARYRNGPYAFFIGPNDHKLLMNLCKGGSEESKWRRFVHVSMDLTAPLYWWKEFDTYKVGNACNS